MSGIINMENNRFFDDDELIKLIISGNRDAEGNLFKKYYSKLLNKIASGFVNIEDAEDLAQDTFIIAIVNIKNGKYVHRQTLFSYLLGISWRLRHKYFKNKKFNSPINDNTNIIDFGWKNDDEDIEIIEAKRINSIVQAIKSLDEPCRKLLTYSFFDGLKPRKIIKLMPELGTTVQISKKRDKCIEKIKRRVKKLK